MKARTILTLGALTLGVMLVLLGFTNRLQAQASPAALSPFAAYIESPGAMCPLTEQQQTDSIAKFSEMMPTFQHPRCLNCHGGVRPFSANTNHAGGKFDLALDADGDILIEKTFGECQNCHGELPGWEVPTSDVWFVDRDAIELCKQMKNELGTAERWMDHIIRDRGKTPFIEAGFTGMRGLNQEGIDYYEALFDKLPVPEPPPGSHATLISMAKAWVDANGGEFKGDESCGCEPQKYAIQINETISTQLVSEEATITWNGNSNVTIPITFKEDGTFTGEVTANRRMHITLQSVISCDQTSVVPVTWRAEGRLDEETYTLHFNVRFLLGPASVSCPYNMSLPVPIYETESANNPFKQMEMSAYVNETKTVELRSNVPFEPVNGKFVVKLIKVN